jgi:polyisoprenoid-binding protein YceI
MTIDKLTKGATESGATPIPAGRYRLDPELTTVSFTAKKFGAFTISGTMALAEGTFTVAHPIGHSSLHAVLAADTFRTPMVNRDTHVKGRTLLDVATYPKIEFDSTEVVGWPTGWEVRGLLSVRGTVAPVTLTVTAAAPEGSMVRLSAVARVNRRDVGVTRMRLAASSMVDVRIQAVGVPVGQTGQSGQTARTSQSGRTD